MPDDIVRNTPFGSSGLRPTRPDQNRFDDDGDNSFSGLSGGLRPNVRNGNRPLTYSPRPRRPRRLSRPSPPKPPETPDRASLADVRAGKTSLVTASTRQGMFPRAGTESEEQRKANIQNLFQAPIAGLSSGAVAQQNVKKFASVTDVYGSGAEVPDLGDQRTKEAFNRFYAPSRLIAGDVAQDFRGISDAQKLRDQDPTRIAFRNQFMASETLKDVNDLTPTSLLFRQKALEEQQ